VKKITIIYVWFVIILCGVIWPGALLKMKLSSIMKTMIKNCITCGKEFQITKWQKTRKYCFDAKCSKGYFNTTNKNRLNAKKK